ncbi:MAG TPA: YHS domain-containing protein [Devosia sp.]|nr:YHS domain-containing protein [Devosia sp.]
MTSRRTFFLGGAALGGAALVGGTLVSGVALAASNKVFVNSAGVAINGTDPVAYFSEDKPVEGSADFATEWMGAAWHFSSAENRDLFVGAPEDYAPQYGGYCAFAVASGYTASTVPEAWTIHNGKLYLNFSLGVRERWRKDMDNLIARADENWPGVLN